MSRITGSRVKSVVVDDGLVNVRGELRNQVALANSIAIAKELGIPHKNVLRRIRDLEKSNPDELGRHKFEPTPYLDMQGKTFEMYDLDEIAALYLLTSFSSKNANAIRMRVIEGFFAQRKWIADRNGSADSSNVMHDARVTARLGEGKVDKMDRVCQAESKLINWLMTGIFQSYPRNLMSEEEGIICTEFQLLNTSFIQAGLEYAARKSLLAKAYKTKGYRQYVKCEGKIAPEHPTYLV